MKRASSAWLLLSLVTGTLVLVLVAVLALSALDTWRHESITSRVLSSGLAAFAMLIVFSRVILPLNAITKAMTSGEEEDIEAALALRTCSDETGLFARAEGAETGRSRASRGWMPPARRRRPLAA